ncbi:lysis protein [Vibrio metschnikovii]|uniref:lysis protein n=1 Tax=Vibrio metschnikovii TaxID=28172 RepID=UPI0013028043|nr:lysis protein [Vibrio metschnikovii]
MKHKAFLACMGLLVIAAILAAFAVQKEQLKNARKSLTEAEFKIAAYVESQELQKQRLEKLAEIGDQSAKELRDAHDEINRLADRLRSGPSRVLVKASCPKPVSDSTTTGGVGHAGAAQLSDTAREDYLHLRRMIVDNEQQIKYLQSYIKTQCMVNQ